MNIHDRSSNEEILKEIKRQSKKILVTGAAGFIGFHLVKRLILLDYEVIGLDSINDYYDVNIKYGRLTECGISQRDIEYNKIISSTVYKNYSFVKLDLSDKEKLDILFENSKFDAVCNLAAQAGVRYSIKNPYAYIESNINGFINILEACRNNNVKNLSYASSSSVYGINKKMPFSTSDNVDHPISLYAATKKSNELMAHTYSYLYGLKTTGMRFFTVYGPWGRPDMALFKFVKNILDGKPIEIYNNGNMKRDFTYIDDIIDGVIKIIENPSKAVISWDGDPAKSLCCYRVYNIGNGSPVDLMRFIECIEKELDKKALKRFLAMQPGDVAETYADTKALENDFGYKPNTSIEYGIKKFINWYKEFYYGKY